METSIPSISLWEVGDPRGHLWLPKTCKGSGLASSTPAASVSGETEA